MTAPPIIRPFRDADADAVVRLWNAAAPHDGISIERFARRVLLDDLFDPRGALVLESPSTTGPELLGFALAKAAPKGRVGWINVLLVHPGHRGRGHGRALLDAALSWLTSPAPGGRGVGEVRFSDSVPEYLLPGIDRDRYPAGHALLRTAGFEVESRPAAMRIDLSGAVEPPELIARRRELEAEGWRFRYAQLDDVGGLARLAGLIAEDWGALMRDVLRHGLPLERIVVAESPEREVHGWAMHGTYGDSLERFGPYGLHPATRGKGVGAVLLHRTLDAMRTAGCAAAWFLWADEGTAASRLYEQSGFRVFRRFDIMVRRTE
ncbi:MAG: GNAT family N-acetyltransferase [Microbacterium sp.]